MVGRYILNRIEYLTSNTVPAKMLLVVALLFAHKISNEARSPWSHSYKGGAALLIGKCEKP